MKRLAICNLKKGDIFQLNLDGPLYVRDHYDRSTKRYSYHPYEDVNKERFAKSSRLVYVD